MLTWLKRGFFVIVSLVFIIILAVFILLRQSLPTLSGEVKSPFLSATVTVERDSLGVPLISGKNRSDIAFATGYIHAQDRFFQMDMSRRVGAGTLSELFGADTLENDKRQRKHRFRHVAQQTLALVNDEQLSLLNAYTNGVNQGLADLGQRPFEYLLLGVEPQPWKNEDTFLSVFSLYTGLNDIDAKRDNLKGFLSRVTSKPVIDFLSPTKTRWDSPLQPSDLPDIPTPGPDLVNLRSKGVELYGNLSGITLEDNLIGSNNWAVSGALTANGAAIIQNDMHLALKVPTVWYRTSWRYPDPEQPGENISITGVTFPGTPFMLVGSNSHVAWGFTNTGGDWVDLVELEINDDRYMTPEGLKPLERWTETIHIKGQPPLLAEYFGTHWGPVVESVYDDTQYALRWIAHQPEATNLNLMYMEKAENALQVMAIANRVGMPPVNVAVGDHQGNIGWTIAGQIPNRSGIDSTYPLPWQRADENWQGWLPAVEYPRVYNPESKRIWTANARVASGKDNAKIGNGGYLLGARQLQIKNALMALDSANEKNMLEVALDHRALYMSNWRRLVLDTLTEDALKNQPARQKFRHYVENWSAKASTDDVGYRLLREYNDALKIKILSSIGRYFLSLSPQAKSGIKDGFMQNLNHETEMVWRLLDERPMNWLNPRYESWDALLLETVDEVVQNLGGVNQLAKATWGQRNTADIRHPMSNSIPVLGKLLKMPAVPLSGDTWMPKAQIPSFGVSQRMVVSPGQEEAAIFHMPGGQSGHPLSPFFTSGYMDWVNGTASSFLPGKPVHVLTMSP